ncbi:GNAT family N-acetyltransferase [Bacillus fonticola]|uniref:GNAT family N-acetyltransferase n=1 Tax=Bacillus fonticola TaxID=2728853 RepID=UPI00223FE6CB|nr:GNAT family N-acetyltransferase [Bacillus fonticola]
MVATENGQVVGLLNIEIESAPREVCSDDAIRSAMLCHIAVHPDHQQKGVGQNY